jgi:transposase
MDLPTVLVWLTNDVLPPGPRRGVVRKRRERRGLKSDLPAAITHHLWREEPGVMSAVVIGIDPHKASHTAVAVDERELALGEVHVRASAAQSDRLLAWAEQWPERSWAIENASGLGYLLAQQLVRAGERVVDVQPKLAARVRLLASAASSKSDPHDARSVAIVALRSTGLPRVSVEDHAAVMKVWIRRRRHLSRMRTRLANQLHVLLCELRPGGFAKEITARQAAVLLESLQASTAADAARVQLAGEILEDLRRVDEQLRDVHKRLTALVLASKTSVTASSASVRSSPRWSSLSPAT